MRGQTDSAVACLAMAAGIGYEEAAAALYEGGRARPVTQSCMLAALSRAGVASSSTMRRVYGWADVPQPSIVCTLLDPSDSYFQWVVLAQGMVFDPGLIAPIRPDHCWRPPISFLRFERAFVPA